MALPEQPLGAIFPILRTSAELGPPFSVLGTAFFIDLEGTFLTACHVFENNPLPENRAYAAAPLVPATAIYKVVNLRLSSRFDIAMGRAEGAAPTAFLPIADADAAMND